MYASILLSPNGASGGLKPSLEVVIVTVAPITAGAIQRLLEEESDSVQCLWLFNPGAGVPAETRPNVTIIAPRNWQEMDRWMPDLQRKFASSSWLLYAELRVSGLFSGFLHPARSTIVGLASTPEEFQADFHGLAEGKPNCPPQALLARFAQGAARVRPRPQIAPLTPKELQCACALSLGLSNRQAAEVLHISESAVKNDLTRLYDKLGHPSRDEAASFIERALSPAV